MTKLATQIAVLDVNIEDLQSEIEATSRIAKALHRDAIRLDQSMAHGQRVTEAAGALIRRSRDLRACLRDQRSALRELRENMSRLCSTLREKPYRFPAGNNTLKDD